MTMIRKYGVNTSFCEALDHIAANTAASSCHNRDLSCRLLRLLFGHSSLLTCLFILFRLESPGNAEALQISAYSCHVYLSICPFGRRKNQHVFRNWRRRYVDTQRLRVGLIRSSRRLKGLSFFAQITPGRRPIASSSRRSASRSRARNGLLLARNDMITALGRRWS